MKVYELAKKLKLRSLDLVEKLRKDWNIPVKNHMQKLTPADLKKINLLLEKEKKKPFIKKKAAASAAGRKKPASKELDKKPALKTSVKTVKKSSLQPLRPAKKQAPSPLPKEKEKEEEEFVPVLRTGIIRRKKVSVQAVEVLPVKKKSEPLPVSAAEPAVKSPAGRGVQPGLVTVGSTDVFKKINESIEFSGLEAEKKKEKKPGGEKPGMGRRFRATDFRKREMIFQPKKKRSSGLSGKSTQITKPKASKRVLKMYHTISIEELSHGLGVKKHALLNRIKKEGLLESSVDVQNLPYDTVVLIASLFDFEVKNISQTKENILTSLAFGDLSAEKQVKPPAVVIMGHVNHGKTTLLDYLRKSRIAKGEAGQITQHIGAYSVPVKKSFVTFIDTPGHSAFTKMRARGGQSADLAVIVAAADDGVQPQTVEAVQHAKAAGVPMIAAINKVDLPSCDLDRIKKQLMELGLTPEEWGGDTIFCPISALTGQGVPDLLEHIHLLAEVHELKANPKRSALGVVIESRVQKGRGQVMSVLVQDGTLKTGQVLMAGEQVGRARCMTNDRGEVVDSAGPGRAVEISGFESPASAGDRFYVVKNEKDARRWLERITPDAPPDQQPLSAEELLLKAHTDEVKTLNIILKTDVAGSAEAIKHSLQLLSTKEVQARVIHSHLGPVNENDVLLAEAGGGIIFSFNTGVDSKAAARASQQKIVIKTYKVIYDLLKEAEALMAGLLDPEIKQTFGGRAEVKQVFLLSHGQAAAGCRVVKGAVSSSHFVKVIREGEAVHTAQITSLKQFKQSVKNIAEGQECGISLGSYKDFKPGDVLESFTRTEIKRTTL